jgi:hypothetical protein
VGVGRHVALEAVLVFDAETGDGTARNG